MRRVFISILLGCVCTSCYDLFLGLDPKNSNLEIFEEFWRQVDKTWPAFETKQVDWDSVYTVYQPRASSSVSRDELIRILTDVTYGLKDTHTSIYPKGSPPILYNPKYPANFYGYEWIRSKYLSSVKSTRAVAYASISQEVGYIYIGSFGNEESQYEVIDEIISSFSRKRAIIIDVRGNGGGSSINSMTIASRFADDRRTYGYAKFRAGTDKRNMGDFLSEEISPAGPTQFKGKVAVLSNRQSYSATEDFILMMKAFPNVIVIGDPTGGGSESRPLFKELPGG